MIYGETFSFTDTSVIDCDKDPFVYEGMQVLSHRKDGQLLLSSLQLVLIQSERQTSPEGLSGHALEKEMANAHIANANVLWHLFKTNLIPQAWEDGRSICFLGSVFLNGLGGKCIQTLRYGERGWDIEMRYFDETFTVNDSVVIRK